MQAQNCRSNKSPWATEHIFHRIIWRERWRHSVTIVAFNYPHSDVLDSFALCLPAHDQVQILALHTRQDTLQGKSRLGQGRHLVTAATSGIVELLTRNRCWSRSTCVQSSFHGDQTDVPFCEGCSRFDDLSEYLLSVSTNFSNVK